MPKQTFFHLSKEKQQRLLDAAKLEFSRVSLKEASIANIVKLAEIPRGSFYQYFEDKEDLFFYYFDKLRQNSARDIEKYIIEAHGDLLEGIDRYFSKMIEEVLTGEHAAFYRQLFLNMDYRSTKRISSQLVEQKKKERHCHQKNHLSYEERFFQHVDTSKLAIDTKEELHMFMQMLMNTVFSSIAEGYRHLNENQEYDVHQTIQHFKKKLNWLKYGIYNVKESRNIHAENC